jgi:hypothetical protein
MRNYVKVADSLIVSNLIIESNLLAAFQDFNPNVPEIHGFKEILDNVPETTNMQVFEKRGYTIKPNGSVSWDYIVTDVTSEDLMDNLIRRRRSFELNMSDWTQTQDAPLSTEKKQAWAQYRQAMRDLPEVYPNLTFDIEVIWPIKPQ